MASLKDYLLEVKLGKDPELNDLFNEALKKVFDPNFLNKIEGKITKLIKIISVKSNKDFVAYVKGNSIFVNTPVFEALPISKRMNYLLHEFIHILQNKKSFAFFKDFKEIHNLENSLWNIIKKYTNDPGKFLTNKNVPSSYIGKHETITYLMNNSINWNEISKTGRLAFVNNIKQSGLFNLDSDFWKERLPH